MEVKRLIIIVEGHTEEEFVNSLLRSYLSSQGIYDVSCFKIKHSRGGLTKYSHFKTDILNCIYQSDTVVTSLIDFYALPIDFPKYEEAKKIPDKKKRVVFLENAVKEEIEFSRGKNFPHFFPYIQIHEFEALIFSSFDGFELYEDNKIRKSEIEKILEEFSNPEDINDGKDTAPSKRLLQNISGYNKIKDGNMMLEEIGMQKILEKCPRFREWVEKIIDTAQR